MIKPAAYNKFPKLPLIHFFLSYWEMDGLSTDLILINVVSNYK